MSNALTLLPGQKESALDAVTYDRTCALLLDVYEASGDWKAAETTADRAIKYLSSYKQVDIKVGALKKRLGRIMKKTGK
ncbi:MAG: hypothetical protein IPJ00_09415 [Saprospirales bacterium]|nr:hypothetical protein [Saprospirales bacterium]